MVLAGGQLPCHKDRLVGSFLRLHSRSGLVISSCSWGLLMIQIHPYLGHQFIDHSRIAEMASEGQTSILFTLLAAVLLLAWTVWNDAQESWTRIWET